MFGAMGELGESKEVGRISAKIPVLHCVAGGGWSC